jgi:endonuclease/exonuclease/phosphatase family metal-dependent hydrolase
MATMSSMRFRLLTYNIHKCIGGMDRKYHPDRIIEVLSHYEPDIAMLQEVDDGVPRSSHHRQVDLIGDALDFRHRAYQKNVRLKKGAYGNAILSRFPLFDVNHVDLTVPLKKRRRALVAHCRVHHEGHTRRMLLMNVHLGLAGYERLIQLRRLLGTDILAHTHRHTPVLIAGDFNDVFGVLGKRALAPLGFLPAVHNQKTFPAALPLRPLDRAFYRGDVDHHHTFAAHSKIARQASDHLPLVMDFDLQPPSSDQR